MQWKMRVLRLSISIAICLSFVAGCATDPKTTNTRETALIRAVQQLQEQKIQLPEKMWVTVKQGNDLWTVTLVFEPQRPGNNLSVLVFNNGTAKVMWGY
jgi:hypothetical protein